MFGVPQKAAVYVRISSDHQGEGLGVARQLEDCRCHAERLGWVVAEEYVDNDVSAWSGKPRPQYERMRDDIKAGSVDGVLSWRPDRLYRQPRELEDLIVLCDAVGGIPIANVTGVVDLLTPEGRAGARFHGALSSYESDMKSERIQRKHQQKAERGELSGGGTRPFGYQADRMTLRPAEAAVVREAASRVLAGESLRSVCADLNERGVRTSAGGRWSITTLKRVLCSGRISGRREHRGEIVADAQWPGIISPGESDRLRARFGAGPSRRAARTRRRYLLTGGLLRCGRCGTPMVAQPRSGGTRRYVCRSQDGGCGGMSATANTLEAWLVEAVLYRLDTPQLAAALAETKGRDAEADDLQQRLTDDKAMLEDLAAQWAAKAITRPEWVAARAPIQQRIDNNQRRLARLSSTTPVDDYAGNAAALRSAWDSLDVTRRHAIVTAVLDHIKVHPASGRGGFDPGRFTPIWKL